MISDHADPLAPAGAKEVGGQNIYVYYLATFLSKLGIAVDVYTRWDKRNKKQIVNVNKNFRVIRIKAGPKGYMARDRFIEVIQEFSDNLLKQIQKENLAYDFIHSNYWFSGLIGLNINKQLKIPQMHVYHSIGQVRFDTLKNYKMQKSDYEFFQNRIKQETRIAHEVNTVIATSPMEEETIMELFKVGKDKIKMISEGVDLNIFHPANGEAFRKKLAVAPKQQMILYVGRIEWRKGIATLLFAFQNVLKEFADAKLYIVGGGKTKASKKLDEAERNRLQQIITQLGQSEQVKFPGAITQERLKYYYSAADVCVVPSYYEPFGIVPLEAMACGTPVVASRTGGLQYTVKDGTTGYLAEPRTPSDVSDKILKVLKHGKAHFTEKSLERIKNMFTWEKVASDYFKFFEETNKQK
jgi:glycosyltransferase involved in cell wall biosynthesis